MLSVATVGGPAPRVLPCLSCSCTQLVCVVITASAAVAMILSGIFYARLLKSVPSMSPPYPTTQIRNIEVFSSIAYTNTNKTTVDYVTTLGNNLRTSIGQEGKETKKDDGKRHVITFGGRGSTPGKFARLCGVVVSSRNEIFVVDRDNYRIQVFAMNGVYIRHFLTTVPGKPGRNMNPDDISIDVNDNLWVVGKLASVGSYVVKYNRDGQALAKFRVPNSNTFLAIAVDVQNDHILVADFDTSSCKIFIYQANGKIVRNIQLEISCSSFIAVNGDGAIFTLENNIVQVFNQRGHLLFKFGGEGRDNGGLVYPQNLCTDISGQILVSDQGNWSEKGWVSMFTSRGKFIRKVATGHKMVYNIAVGQDGQLVVTDKRDNTVTIYSTY
ncbi:E3 ubiquitin-protein ligase TRIM32-like [Branchiostoma floridae x Branchiostoma japonicum]